MNLCGRIMLGVRRHGLSDPQRAGILARAIVAVVDHHYPDGRPSLLVLEPLLTEQLAMLEAALMERRMRKALGHETVSAPPLPVKEEQESQSTPAVSEERTLRKRTLKGKGYTVVAKSMDEKLREGRQPVQELLQKDCVDLGLLDRKQAERMVRSMLGKRPEDAEQEIVEQLRQILQEQVKGIIRQLKGGPWAKPQAQEEIRQDIAHARSVKSVLLLARQVIKERRAWEEKHGKGGLFGGLLGGRRRGLR
ncbi:MAG: hypothetical protein D6720_11795 [Gammaproteobacteria bacterium]|nr:MAG: hypothetical protein D6720_11795 [Gammaproteobacteria bacterium]